MNILSIDPGHKRIAYAGYDTDADKIIGIGILHRHKGEIETFASMFVALADIFDLALIERQYIKRVRQSKLQTAIAASTMKVMRAAAHCEILMLEHGKQVEWIHPKTWQTILKTSNEPSVQVKKLSRRLAENWIGSVPNQDVADAVTMLKWYLITHKHIKE